MSLVPTKRPFRRPAIGRIGRRTPVADGPHRPRRGFRDASAARTARGARVLPSGGRCSHPEPPARPALPYGGAGGARQPRREGRSSCVTQGRLDAGGRRGARRRRPSRRDGRRTGRPRGGSAVPALPSEPVRGSCGHGQRSSFHGSPRRVRGGSRLTRTLLLTALVMIAFADNSVLNRLAVADGAIGAAPFAVIRLASGALALGTLMAIRGRGPSSGGWIGPGLAPRLHGRVLAGLSRARRRHGGADPVRGRAGGDVRGRPPFGRAHRRDALGRDARRGVGARAAARAGGGGASGGARGADGARGAGLGALLARRAAREGPAGPNGRQLPRRHAALPAAALWRAWGR